jgi:hypothetical protein
VDEKLKNDVITYIDYNKMPMHRDGTTIGHYLDQFEDYIIEMESSKVKMWVQVSPLLRQELDNIREILYPIIEKDIDIIKANPIQVRLALAMIVAKSIINGIIIDMSNVTKYDLLEKLVLSEMYDID